MAKQNGELTAAEKGKGKMVDTPTPEGKKQDEGNKGKDGKKGEEPDEGQYHVVACRGTISSNL